MELRQLRSLVALADERNFTRAAARLNVAQPLVSQHIRRLEDELELTLVDRTTQRVDLTAAGEALVVRARAALAEVEAAVAEMRERSGVLSGTVTVGVSQTPGPFDLPALLARFHRNHPGIGLVVRDGPSGDLVEHLRADRLDAAFVTNLEAAAVRGLELGPLVHEELVLVVAADHHLAGRASVGVAALRDESFVAFREGSTIRATVRAAAERAGFAPNVAFEVSEVARLRAIVAEGLGVAILPRSDAEVAGPPVVIVGVDDPTFVHRVSLVWRAGRHHAPAARAFLTLAGGVV